MQVILLLFVVTLSFAQERAPRNHFALMGGGGEPHREPQTIFDHEVEGFGNFLAGSRGRWQTRAAFNGGHSQSEQMVDRLFGPSPAFTENTYAQMLQHYKNELTSGRIGRGDQLLVQLSSHGALRAPGQKSHSISAGGQMTDPTSGAGSSLVPVDDLQEVINLANEKGVKLAILDFSCHSGSSIALANPKTCVISSSGPQHFGSAHYIGFPARFSSELRRGRNLEEVFLRTMNQRPLSSSYGYPIPPTTGFPMISSPGARTLQDEFYRLLTAYQYHVDSTPLLDKLGPISAGVWRKIRRAPFPSRISSGSSSSRGRSAAEPNPCRDFVL